jgi:hypothetical protein
VDRLAVVRQRIAKEAQERTGFLDLGRLGLSSLPDELFELKQLRRLNLGASFRDEAGQPHSSASDFEENFVEAELDRIAELPDLQYLSVSGTSLRDLARLQSNLQSLDCSHTQVRDITPLKGLSNLQSLSCRKTEVSDLAALQSLYNLQSLDCSHTQVSDLAPLQGLSNLQTLDCSYTQIRDLTPLKGLSSLQSLDCWQTRVRDLAPLQGLSKLQTLGCSVSDLAPLKGLSDLQSLSCFGTQLSDDFTGFAIDAQRIRALDLAKAKRVLVVKHEQIHRFACRLRAHRLGRAAELAAAGVAITAAKVAALRHRQRQRPNLEPFRRRVVDIRSAAQVEIRQALLRGSSLGNVDVRLERVGRCGIDSEQAAALRQEQLMHPVRHNQMRIAPSRPRLLE